MSKNSLDKMIKNSPATKILKEAEQRKANLEKAELEKITAFLDICYDVYSADEYKTGTKSGNIIGDRIKHLLKKMDMTVVELAEKTEMSRSRLQSYLTENCYETTKKKDVGKHYILPKPQTLLKIIDVLNCHIDDFVYSPKDFEKWLCDYEYGYYLNIDLSKAMHIQYDAFKGYVTAQLSFPFSYFGDGMEIPMPEKVREILSQQIISAFEAVDVLLQYDNKITTAKARYLTPMIEDEEESVAKPE